MKKRYEKPAIEYVQVCGNIAILENSGETSDYMGKKNDLLFDDEEDSPSGSAHRSLWGED